ncbi:MAG: hypothetical protein KY476_06510 [Planctomycetes bacterium]|nr:hypothetical protein [Planctomycetota bacterium]
MSPATGDLLVDWTARAAVAAWAGRYCAEAWRPGHETGARWSWTAGCLMLLVHIVCALGIAHGWSHRAALEHTARRTDELLGWAWGGGLYFNYVFAAVWSADVFWWWLPRTPRPRTWTWFVHIYLAFVVVNATVVFGPPFWKPLAAVFTAGLLALWAICRQRRSQ